MIEWVETFYMSNESFRIHEEFYDKNKFKIDFLCEKVMKEYDELGLGIFQQDLLRVFNKRNNSILEEYAMENKIDQETCLYLKNFVKDHSKLT